MRSILSDDVGGEARRQANPGATADLAAACAGAVVLAQLLLAPLTFFVLTCLLATDKLTRWRPLWLAGPAAVGTAMVLSVGPARAAAGYAAAGGRLWAVLAGSGPIAARLARLPEDLVGSPSLLAAQLPMAVGAAAAQAWLAQRIRRRRRGSARAPAYRPGALVAIRRSYLTASLRRGEVATADGGCLGISEPSGKRAVVSWREAEHGVLCTGSDPAAVTATGLDLAVAAIQHRKAVIIVDLIGQRAHGRAVTASADTARLVASACARVGAPLRQFGGTRYPEATLASYDPFAGLSPDQAADRLLAVIDWSAVDQVHRRFCSEYLRAALAVLAAAGEPGGRARAPLTAELLALLRPGALGKRLAMASGPASTTLADRVSRLAGELSAAPAVLAPIAAQLAAANASPLGHSPARCRQAGISLGATLVERGVVLFDLDRRRDGPAAGMIARLVVEDLAAILRDRHQAGTPTDCLLWVNGCEVVPAGPLAGLVALGPEVTAVVVLGTVADQLASLLADYVGVVAIRGQAPPWLETLTIGASELTGADAFWLRVRMPQERLVTGRAVR